MSNIHKAFAVFQLEPGASREAIQRRYRRLSKVWHPDRFESEEDKREAEEELKKINNANDIFKKHFEQDHKATGCECQRPVSAGGASEQRTGPGPGRKKTSETDPEAEAKRRDEERKRKAATEEAARKAAEEETRRQQQAATENLKEAAAKQDELKMNKLRWQIAAAEAALFIGLCFFGWAGYGIKEWWHDFTWHWQNDHQAHQDTAPSNNYFNNNTSTNTGYVPPYMVPPTQTTSPYQNTAPPPDSTAAPPSNYSVPPVNTNPPGFNWKPITPSTSTQTDTGTGIDFDKYLKH